MGHEIKKGTKVSFQINIHEVHQLEKKYNNPHVTHGQSGEDVNQYDTLCTEMEYDPCIYKALTKSMIQETEDRCVVPWFPMEYSKEQIGSHTVCTKEQDINKTYYTYWNRITNQRNDCNKPCKSVVLNIGGKNYEYKNETNPGIGLFYFSMTSTQSKEKELKSFLSLVAEIGGYMGLLLGYSCLDLASTIRNASEKRSLRRIKASN